MDNEPATSLLKKIAEIKKNVDPSPFENNEAGHLVKQTCTSIKIEDEDSSDTVEKYATTTIGELLGWYSHDKIENGCTRSLNFDHFASNLGSRSTETRPGEQKPTSNRQMSKSPTLATANTSNLHAEFPDSQQLYPTKNLNKNRQSTSTPISQKKVLSVSTSKFPYKNFTSICSDNIISCSWCGQIVQTCESRNTNSLSCNTISTLDRFCTEACFIAGRRAVFNCAETCDWCKHVQHPIDYVESQGGERQLQFCSNNCLNQYKINIFCHETQAHLMLHGMNNVSLCNAEKSSLITPELWFRNCQSPLNSPTDSIFIDNEQFTSNLSSPSYNQQKEKEQSEVGKLTVSSRKKTRKENSFYINKYTKCSHYGKRKRNHGMQINESDFNEMTKEQIFTNKKNKFSPFVNNKNHFRTTCSERNTLNCKNYEINCSFINVANDNSYNHQKNDTSFLEKSKCAKNIRNLQQEKIQELSEKILKSANWFANTGTPPMENKMLYPYKLITGESCQKEYEKQDNVNLKMALLTLPMHFNGKKSSTQSVPTSLFPPTIFVPYPVPIPILIPIPVPISTPPFTKAMTKQNISKKAEDIKYKKDLKYANVTTESFIQDEAQQQSTDTNVTMSETTKHLMSKKNLYSLKRKVKPVEMEND